MSESETKQSPIVIYEGADNSVEVRLDAAQQTVWLSLQQLSELFDRDKSGISRHLSNIFNDGELDRDAVVAKNATTATDGKTYQMQYFNLDAIISVGYRVNSTRATGFRQWATRILRDHLTRGWTLNQQRFETNARELEAALALVRKAARSPALDTQSGRGLVDIVSRYAQTFLLLQRYDEGLLTDPEAQPGGALPDLSEAAPPSTTSRPNSSLVARPLTSLLGIAVMVWPRCWVTSIRPFSASRLTLASNPRPHTCCTSSSKTTRSRMATSAAPPFYLSIFCTAMDVF